MKLDLSCPVELWHFRMPTRDYPVVTLQLFNLSDKSVTSIQAAFACYDREGERLSRQVERVQGLTGDKRSAFEMIVAVEDGERAASMDLIIEKIWFMDGTVWRRGQNDMVDYVDNRLPKGKQLDVLRHVAGADVCGYPSDQGAIWVCVCGRPNPASLAVCARCERDKHEVFTQFGKASIEKIIFVRESALEEKARHAREEAGRMQAQREEQEMRRKKHRRRLTVSLTTLVVLAGGAYGVYFHGIPAYTYYRAGELMKQGEYAQAKELYIDLDDYADSADLVKESDYLRAGAAAATANLTSLKAAQDLYETLPGYKDSGERAGRMRLERAQLLRAGGEYEQAIALFGEIPGFGDADQLAVQTRYDWANALMENLDYASAREKFLVLGSYQESASLAEACLYKPALAHLEKGEFPQAIALLSQLKDQTLALPKLQESYYRWGDQLFAAQDYEVAAEKFLLAGEYLDSSLRAAACLYEPAKVMMAAGDYAGAREKLLKVPTFQDAAMLAQECAFRLGLEAMQANDYELALSHLQLAPAVPEAAAALREAAYLQGKKQQEAGDMPAAVAMYEQAGDYSDAQTLVAQLRFELALQAVNVKDYDRAILLFSLLGDYEGSAEELRRAQYNRAIASIEQGSYEQAISEFTALADYQGSEEYLKQAQYLAARQAFEAGDYQTAAEGYLAAGDFAGAQDGYRESIYLQAQQTLAADNLVAATPLLKQIEGYKDATDLLQSTAYKVASELKAAGDYRQAAEQFQLIRDYQDAKAQAEESYDLYYADAYKIASDAIKKKDFKTAIEALEPLDRRDPNDKYRNVQALYENAVYLYANKLYDAREPYLALPYYRKIPDYKDVTRTKLTRTPYRILGAWQTEKGFKMTFREDGTCTIDGRDYLFYARNYLLAVGDRREELNTTYNILALSTDQMNLRRDDPRTLYKMTRVTP